MLCVRGKCINIIWVTDCVGFSQLLSAIPYVFLRRLELFLVLLTHIHIFCFIYLCGGYREAKADLPYSFIYCDLKDHSCTQVSRLKDLFSLTTVRLFIFSQWKSRCFYK